MTNRVIRVTKHSLLILKYVFLKIGISLILTRGIGSYTRKILVRSLKETKKELKGKSAKNNKHE